MEEEKKANTADQEVVVAKEYRDEYLQKILELEKSCFPEEWQYDDAEDYYKEVLINKTDINIFLKSEDSIVGYLLAVPQSDAFEELAKYDSKFENDSSSYYLETIQIFPDFSGRGGAKKMILKMCQEANKRGIYKFSVHARKINNFNLKLKKIFKNNIVCSREIKKWHFADGEPYEFISWISS